MGASSQNSTLWVAGRLYTGITDPTDPSTGAELGLVAGVELHTRFETHDITAEEYGGEVVDVIQGAQSPILYADLMQWNDDDAKARAWPNVSGSAGSKVIDHPGTSTAGAQLSGRATVILFYPDDATNHDGFLAYSAVPVPRPETVLPFNVLRELKHPVCFKLLRDSSGRTYQVGKVAAMTAP